MEFLRYSGSDQVQKDPALGAEVMLDILTFALQIDAIMEVKTGKNDWSGLAGATVLDLGCGSAYTPRTMHYEGWPPYFAKLCASNGATVYGIDLHDADEFDAQQYIHITTDLVPWVVGEGLGAIPEIAGLRFDIIFSHLLDPGSRDLARVLEKHRIRYAVFRAKLEQQAKALLTPGGILYLEGKTAAR